MFNRGKSQLSTPRPRGSGPWARRTTQAVVIEGSVRGCETNADAAG